MNCFKFGLIDQDQCVQALHKLSLERISLLPETIHIVNDILDNITEDAALSGNTGDAVFASCDVMLRKCYFIFYTKLEIKTTDRSDSRFQLFNLFDSVEEKSVFLTCLIENYSYPEIWEIIIKLNKKCSNGFCENLKENISSVLHDEFFQNLTDTVESCTNIHQVNILRNAGLIYTAYLQVNNGCLDNICPHENLIMKCMSGIRLCEEQTLLNCYLNLFIEPFLNKCNLTCRNKVLGILWTIVKSSFVSKDSRSLKQLGLFPFSILSFITNLAIEAGFQQICFLGEDYFWQILLLGLIHQDALARKQSYSILKCCISICSHGNALSSEYISCTDIHGPHFSKFWNEYFLCFETLEENQSHVVHPIQKKLSLLWKMVAESGFNCEWVFVLYKRMFDHDTRSVRLWAITHLLQLDFNQCYLHVSLVYFVPNYLLPVLKEYNLFLSNYSDDSASVKLNFFQENLSNQLAVFFPCLTQQLSPNQREMFIKGLLNELFGDSTWEDVSHYHVIKSLINIPPIPCISFDFAKSVIHSSQACWTTQEQMLRDATQSNLCLLLLSHLDNSWTPFQLAHIAAVLGGVSFLRKRKYLWNCFVRKMKQIMLSSTDVSSEEFYDLVSNKYPPEGMKTMEQPDAVVIYILLKEESSSKTKHDINIQEILSISLFLKDCASRPYICQNKLTHTLELCCQYLDAMLNISSLPIMVSQVNLIQACQLILKGPLEYMDTLAQHLDMNNSIKHVTIIDKMIRLIINYAFPTEIIFFMHDFAAKLLGSIESSLENFQVDWENRNKHRIFIYLLCSVSNTLFKFLNQNDQLKVLNLIQSHLLGPLTNWLRPAGCGAVVCLDRHQLNGIRLEYEELTSTIWNCLQCFIKNVCTAC